MKNDQLHKIFEVIGTPTKESDLEFISSETAIKYIKHFGNVEKVDLAEKYPGTDS